MKGFFVILFGSLFSLSSFAFEQKTIVLNGVKLKVEVAKTRNDLERGLMFRKKIDPNYGMLFEYPNESQLSFWMKNTFIPLSIGFFNKKRELIDIQDMEPVKSEMQENIPTYQSRGLAMYALEVDRGWFLRNNIKLKARFEFVHSGP